MCGSFGLFAVLGGVVQLRPVNNAGHVLPSLEHSPDGPCADGAAAIEPRSVRDECPQAATLGSDRSAQQRKCSSI